MEKRKEYFGSQMVKNGSAAVAISLTTVIMVFSIAVLVPEPSLGGEQGERRRPSPELMMERLGTHLQLSAEQQVALEPVIAEEILKRRALLDQYRAEDQERRREVRLEMIEIDEDTADRLAAILSPEQLDKFSRLQEKRRMNVAFRPNGRRGRSGHSAGATWPEDRSDDQPSVKD